MRVRSRAAAWGVFLSGASIGVIAFGTGLIVVGDATKPTPSDAWSSVWFKWGVAALVAGGFLFIAGCYFTFRDGWKRRESPFSIEYDPSDERCKQTHGVGTTLRLKVRNRGPVGLRRVTLELEDSGARSYSHLLTLRHDNVAPYLRSLNGAPLSSGDGASLYFDVVFLWEDKDELMFVYADEALRAWSRIAREVRVLTFTARGEWDDVRTMVEPGVTKLRLTPVGRGLELETL